jgi:hypothetical protein
MLGGYHYNNLREALLKQVTLPNQYFLVSSSASPSFGGHFDGPGCFPDANGYGSNAISCGDSVS